MTMLVYSFMSDSRLNHSKKMLKRKKIDFVYIFVVYRLFNIRLHNLWPKTIPHADVLIFIKIVCKNYFMRPKTSQNFLQIRDFGSNSLKFWLWQPYVVPKEAKALSKTIPDTFDTPFQVTENHQKSLSEVTSCHF